MSISLDVRDLDPLQYVTAERVASLRRLYDDTARNHAGPDQYAVDWHVLEENLPNVRVLLMALEQLTAKRE